MTRQDTAARKGAAKKAKNGGGKYAALSMIALYAFAVLAVLLAVSVFVRHSTQQQGAALRALYTPPSPAAAQAADPAPAGEEKPAVIPARFEELYEINQELIGWLRVGALVDEPVVYRDNEYYLHHSFRGNASNSGTVFADMENDRWAHDAYVVLYGHNIRGGDKFGPLAQYRELDCLKENPLISWDTISGDDAALYAVFSVFDASMLPDSEDYFYLRRFDELRTGGDEAMQLLIDELRERSLYDVPIDVAPQDGLLALVTCSYSNSDGRLMVFARRLRASESAEDICSAAALASVREAQN